MRLCRLATVLAGLCALSIPAPVAAQKLNQEGFWSVAVEAPGTCSATASTEDGDFALLVREEEITFAVVTVKPVPRATRGILELGPYAFDFMPSQPAEDVVMFQDALNPRAFAALLEAEDIGVRLDGRQLVAFGLRGTGYLGAIEAAADCASGEAGWWGQGAVAAQDEPDQSRSTGDSSGTGFFVTDDGVGVTNAHVVNGCAAVSSPAWGKVTVIAVDKAADLAIFRTERAGGAHVALRERGPRLGEPLTAAGFPLLGILGEEVKVTTGVVSALSGLGGDRTQMQISAPIQPGNSGGPVIDGDGALIGVAVAKLDEAVMLQKTGILPQNVNFAVTVGALQALLDENGVAYTHKRPAQSGVEAMPAYTFSLLCKGDEK